MSNFNELFKREGAQEIVNRFVINNADRFSETKITSYNVVVEEEEKQPASYYVREGLTAVFKIRVEYTLSDNPDQVSYAYFEVPREVDGQFIIEGKYYIPFNRLESSKECRIYKSLDTAKGKDRNEIVFDSSRFYDANSGTLVIKNDVGVDVEKTTSIKYDKIDYVEGDLKEKLKLTETQSKKFQIKLDLDYVPEYINTKLIDDCLEYGDDQSKDLIIDKEICNSYKSFRRYMFQGDKLRYYRVRSSINSYFVKNKALKLDTISTLALGNFKGNSSKSAVDPNIQFSPGINAINIESAEAKISIPNTMAYNTSMADLIDIAEIPINAGNKKKSSRLVHTPNSLTVSTHLTEKSEIEFEVFDKEFRRITILYIDYLNSKVCASEYVDYENAKLKPNENGQVEVKHRMRRKMVDINDIDFIDLHPDYRLSRTTRRIPFINSTDSVRIGMGAGMLKQSIPLVEAQRPLVDTGRGEELVDNILNDKFKHDKGTVVDIDEDNVLIKLDKTSEIIKFPRKSAIKGNNDVCVYTTPKVKKGQKVKKGDVITGAHNLDLDNNVYRSGLNALVLFHAYHGLVNEDALVVSESFANRMRHYSIIDISFPVNDKCAIKWIAPVGTRVKSKMDVVTLNKAINFDKVNKNLADNLGVFDLEGLVTEVYKAIPNNIEEAVISDVSIQKLENPIIPGNVKAVDYTFSHTSDKVIKEYMDNMDRSVIYKEFPEYVAADRLKPTVMNREDYSIVYTINIRLIKITKIMCGSKVTNRYGGKGVVSVVKPDHLMPKMVDSEGKEHIVEVVMNPYSTVNRKIAGVLMEQELGLIAHKLSDLVNEYKNTATGKKKIMPLINKYYPGRYEKMDVEDFISLHNSKPIEEVYYFNVGCYSDYTPERVHNMMEDLGLEAQNKILMPEEEVTDLAELKANLPKDEYVEIAKSIRGKFVPVEKKLQCGWMTMIDLYHIPSYNSKVTSSMFGTGHYEINPKKSQPLMGKGLYRDEGQSISEMELAVLLSRNAKSFIESSRDKTRKAENQTFLNNLLALGLTITDDEGFYQGGSSLKSDLKQLKTKFRLKNNTKI
jgi:hypothetical protein